MQIHFDTRSLRNKLHLAVALALMPAASALAQDAAADTPATPAVPTSAGQTGPLVANPAPASVDLGQFGTWYVTGAVTGLGLWQDNRVPGDDRAQGDLSNAQLVIQKPSGMFQFFVALGAYSLPSLGTPYLDARTATSAYYGYVPEAFVKFVPNDSFNIMAGKLPTLVGGENTFTFENMNIERGLLWNQENAVNRGVRASYVSGPVTVAVWGNDGFYSDHYNWLWGSLVYAIDESSSLTFIGGGNLDETASSSTATPLLQNNGQMYNLIYSRTDGPWTITPYLQYTNVPRNTDIGIPHSASTFGAAFIGSYRVDDRFSLAGRVEYIASSGGADEGTPNLLYGPGSDAWSVTFTPTWQYKTFFVRGELSYVKATNTTPGFAFGSDFTDTSQSRVMVEAGFVF